MKMLSFRRSRSCRKIKVKHVSIVELIKRMVKHTLDQPIDIVVRLYVYYSVKRLNESNMAIYKAFLKYGHSNFKLEILEYCEKENALFREQHYIDLLKPEYNINPIAGSSLGYKHTEQSLALMGG